MNPPRHTLDQLVVLDAIARTGSLAGAARELNRVPSAVSYTVRALEEAVGVALFDRSGHRVSLTAAGARVLEEGRDVLARARRLEQIAGTLGEGWESDLRVVVDGAYPMRPITAVMRALAERRVPTRLSVDVEYVDGVIHRFDADNADLMLALGLEDGGRLRGLPLGPLEMVLVVGEGHPLAGRTALTRDALSEHVDLVVKDSSPAYARTPRRAFLGSQHVIRLSDFHAKRLAILDGVGFGWIPLHLVEADLEAGQILLLDLPEGNRWTYQPQLIHRRDAPLGRCGALFVELLLGGVHQKI